MTHDTPDGAPDDHVWCPDCRIAVVPSADGGGPTCPACGAALGDTEIE